MTSHASKFLLLTLLSVLIAASAAAQDMLPELVKRIKPSAVAVEAFDGKGNSVARGSGFFIGPDRVITNRHVIERSARVDIHLVDGRKVPVKGVLAVDGEGDLAMLQVAVPGTAVASLPISPTVPQEGESIVVVGNPFGLEGSVSNGIVSAVREIGGYGKIIQITAPISAGSSGSPVVNMYGQVVGVATLQAEEGQSLNFAVPSARIRQLKVTEPQSVLSLASGIQKNKRAAAESLYSQGVALLSRDDFARAVTFFEKATDTDPNYAEAWYQAGFAYGTMGRHTESLKASKQAAKLRPEWAEAFVNIGASSFALGQFKDAVDAYKQALKLDANRPDTQYALGLTFEKLGRTDEEMLAYKRALALDPAHANAMDKLGAAYVRQKRFPDAVAIYDQLKVVRPDARTYASLGESLFEVGRFDDSVNALNTAVSYDPDLDRARYDLGRAYLKAGNRDMARVQYEILRTKDSDWSDRLLAILDN